MERPPSSPSPAAVAGEAEFADAQRVHKIPPAAWKRRLDEKLPQMPQQFSLSWLQVRLTGHEIIIIIIIILGVYVTKYFFAFCRRSSYWVLVFA